MRQVRRVQWCTVLVLAVLLGLGLHAQSDPRKRNRIARRRGSNRCRPSPIASPRRRAPCSAICGGSSSSARSSNRKWSKAEAELARVSIARDNAADHVEALAATRIAETPGVTERLVELSKRGRAGYVQLLLASNDVRAMGRMARGVAAVAELDRVRLETHRRTLAAERIALNELEQQRAAVATLQREATRARAAVDAAVAARNRLIDDLDRRRDLAAQFVVELQQAQVQLERTIATADAASTVAALPIRPFQGDLPGRSTARSTSRFGRAPSGRFGTSIVRNGIEVAAAEGVDGHGGARRHGGIRGALCRLRHAGDRRSRRLGVHACMAICWMRP